MEKLLNCTPHVINLITPSRVITLPPSGICPRVEEAFLGIAEVAGVEVVESDRGSVEGLPEPQDGVLLIVSRMVADACSETREDLVSPGELVRDPQGRVIGCKNLIACSALALRIDYQNSIQARRELWEDMRDDEGPLN